MEDNGNFYLRYMDDIWIFDDDEEKLWSILLDIDNFARERGLCLNPLKTSISSFDESDFIDFEPSGRTIIELDDVDFTNEMDAIIDLDNIYSHESNEPKLNMSIDEFMNNCGYQVIENYNNILEIDQNNNELNKNLQNLVVKYCYKMNKAFEAIEYYDYRLLNYDSIDNYIFINLLNSYFWKCEPICKVLSFYEKSINLKNQLFELFHQYDSYEWFVFHIAKCLYRKQKLDLFDVRMIQIYIDSSNSWLAKSALYPLILKNTQEDEDVSSAIKRDLFEKEDYKVIRSVVFNEYKDLCSVKLFTNEEIKNILKKDQNV